MVRRYLFLFVIIALLLVVYVPANSSPGSGNPPNSDEVIDEHRQLLKKYGIEKKVAMEKDSRPETRTEPYKGETDSQRNTFLSKLAKFFSRWSLPLIIVIILALIALFYFALRGVPGFFPGRGEETKEKKVEKGDHDVDNKIKRHGDEWYETALGLARKKQFGKALIVLHKSTLKKLQENNFIPAGEHFTNNEIKVMIKNSKTGIYNPFTRLAGAAERVAFKREEPAEDTYLALKKMYEHAFLFLSRNRGR